MKRELGWYASFAIAFGFVSIATGIFTTYGSVLASSGARGIWAWPIAVVGQAAVALVLGALAARIPVVLCSRTGAGAVHTHTYGGAGSEEDLLAKGLVHGGHLAPLKARILLVLLLAGGADRAAVHRAFATHGG